MGIVMKTGIVKAVISNKGFGFITTEDRTDIFFHIKVLGEKLFNSLKRGQSVEFKTKATPKGLAVTKLNRIKPALSQELFVKPQRFIKTPHDTLRRGHVFFRTPISSRYFKSPDDAEAEVRKKIAHYGANALLNAQMKQERRRDGNYVYRVFKLTGDCALVMEKANSKSSQTYTRSEAQNMGSNVRSVVDNSHRNNSVPQIDKRSDDEELSGATIAFFIGVSIMAMMLISS